SSYMSLLLILVLVLAASYWLWRLAPPWPSQWQAWQKVCPVACLIGAVRIGALWIGAVAYRNPGWPQGLGYFLQLLALPEIHLVRAMRGRPAVWLIMGQHVAWVHQFFLGLVVCQVNKPASEGWKYIAATALVTGRVSPGAKQGEGTAVLTV